MKKRLQVILTDEAWNTVETITQEANENFKVGTISYSDVISELIVSAKIDVKTLQIKHTNLRRSLLVMAKGPLDIDSVIKSLMDLKAKTGKRALKGTTPLEETS